MNGMRYCVLLMLCVGINVMAIMLDQKILDGYLKNSLRTLLQKNIKKNVPILFATDDVEKNVAEELGMSVADLKVWIETKKKPDVKECVLQATTPLQQAVVVKEIKESRGKTLKASELSDESSQAAMNKNVLESIHDENTKTGLKKVVLGESPGKKMAESESLLNQITSTKNRLKNAQDRQLVDKPAEPETVLSQIRQGKKLKSIDQ